MNVEELQTNIKNDEGESVNIIDYFNDNSAIVAKLIRTEDSKQRCMGFMF